ncbi:MAG: hypothetical protein V3S64_04950, partial [bacterium]
MLDRLGTVVGFVVGAALIIFGITWPDQKSNYYVYQLTQFEQQLDELKKASAPNAQIQAVRDD